MCVEIELGDEVIETIGKLVALVGRDNIVISPIYASSDTSKLFKSEFCLCPVDIPATASKAGYASQDPNVGIEDWHSGYRWEKSIG